MTVKEVLSKWCWYGSDVTIIDVKEGYGTVVELTGNAIEEFATGKSKYQAQLEREVLNFRFEHRSLIIQLQ